MFHVAYQQQQPKDPGKQKAKLLLLLTETANDPLFQNTVADFSK